VLWAAPSQQVFLKRSTLWPFYQGFLHRGGYRFEIQAICSVRYPQENAHFTSDL
jgi:hypothetical protein